MRWSAEKPTEPEGGDQRSRRVFAWRPTKVGTQMVWLERYEITEKFFSPRGGSQGWWSEVSRSTLDYYL